MRRTTLTLLSMFCGCQDVGYATDAWSETDSSATVQDTPDSADWDTNEVSVPDTNENSGWIQPKSPDRPVQRVSSYKSCFCFPDGNSCAAVLHHEPWQAPQGYVGCDLGEACSGDPAGYGEDHSTPQGQCLRVCFHEQARTDGALPASITAYMSYDCAAAEECRLTSVVSSFEGIPTTLLGLCFPEYSNPN